MVPSERVPKPEGAGLRRRALVLGAAQGWAASAAGRESEGFSVMSDEGATGDAVHTQNLF